VSASEKLLPAHPLAGKTVILKSSGVLNGKEFVLEDWWLNLHPHSWATTRGNTAAIQYAARVAATGLPVDDRVVYGKVYGSGYLIHETELGPIADKAVE
jgi:hypothetical protein